MAASGTSRGKMLAKLEKSVRGGNFYEAQQVYKSVTARYTAQGKVEDTLELLQSGACVQLEFQQVNCGVELGTLLVETLAKASVPFSKEQLDRLLAVYRAFVTPGAAASAGSSGAASEGATQERGTAAGAEPEGGASAGASVPGRPSPEAVQGAIEFLKPALRWSMRVEGGAKMGAPELHDCMAECYWKYAEHKDMAMAAQHFVLGTSPAAFAGALREIMASCFPDELDLVAARAVFQYLSTGNLRGANEVLEALQAAPSPGAAGAAEDADLALPDSPLMHFLAFLLLALERDAYPLFQMLRAQYEPSLARDPSFDTYLDEVAQKFYGVRKQQGGFLGSLMQMLTTADS